MPAPYHTTQIDICALGPLRITSELFKAGKIKKDGSGVYRRARLHTRLPACLHACSGRVAIISSQAGSAAWRTTQNKNKGGDYGHHMSRAACNIAGS